MSAPKFSPGPWGVAIGKSISVVQLGVTGPAVAVCNYDNGPIERANARLIAAAPELYEALKNCVDLLEVTDKKEAARDPRHPLNAARAALAKAMQP